MSKITRRSFIKAAGATAAMAAMATPLAACSSSDEKAVDETETASADDFKSQGKGEHLVVGRRGKLFKIAPSVIAEKLGYFEEEGCDVEFQQVELAEGFASLSTGNLDAMLMGVVQTCEYIAKGSPMYMFGGTVLNGTEILAKEDFIRAPFEGPEDFKGYNIAYHRPETGQIAFRAWLKDAGLDIDGGDVTFTPLDNEQAMVEAVLKGEVDMCLCNNAFGYVNRDRGIQVIGAVPDFTGDYPCCRQNASENAYKNKFQSLVDFEIGILRGYKVFKTDPDQAIPMMAEYSEQSEDYVKAALYGTEDYRAVMELLPDPCTKAVVNFYDSLISIGEIDGSSAPEVDEYAVADIYRTALDTLMEREPKESFWQDLDALYKENND